MKIACFFVTAFHHNEDSLAFGSLALGPASMPSISDLDQSLTLSQFPQFPPSTTGLTGQDVGTRPSIGELDQSISLPQFPRSSRGHELDQSISLPQFPRTSRGDELEQSISFPQSSRGQASVSSINEVSRTHVCLYYSFYNILNGLTLNFLASK